MQCVILAAGEGTRMRPLTLTMPKPLVLVCGVPLIEHIVRPLPPCIDELIIVVGYKGEMIREYCGAEFLGRKVTYVEQENPKAGTADALMYARDIAKGKFLVLYADDIHGADALAEVVEKEAGMLAARSATPEKFGVLVLNDDGTLREIVEKPAVPPSNYVNIGGFVVTEDIFAIHTALSASGEYYLTDTVTEYAKTHPVTVVEQTTWIPVGSPEDIPKAEAVTCPR
jgi:UDP-N-acetylglucosamine diphosphorylase / glucose-1-phosphate thymidylyltransferase / UDP-N-acetylgalactosamine diphosphorylase / glucosamine-1-phosphate N-acetyltransferase / galactosamine-1-phosphate N-acetyltransferase